MDLDSVGRTFLPGRIRNNCIGSGSLEWSNSSLTSMIRTVLITCKFPKKSSKILLKSYNGPIMYTLKFSNYLVGIFKRVEFGSRSDATRKEGSESGQNYSRSSTLH
jgi:hypothetical protein